MDAVTHDLNAHFKVIDAIEAREDFIESELEWIETNFQERLEAHHCIIVSGFGVLNLLSYLKLLTIEEFHPQQGYRWLAVQHLAAACEHDSNSRLSGWDIINYARQRGYCNG